MPAKLVRDAWAWMFKDFKDSLALAAQNKSSLRVISPTLYNINNTGGDLSDNGGNNIGSSDQAIAAIIGAGFQCHPCIQAGAGNPNAAGGGKDDGVIKILTDTIVRHSFVTQVVDMGRRTNVHGYNVDVEPGNLLNEKKYALPFAELMARLGDELQLHGMKLTMDSAPWYVAQTLSRGGNALVDLGLYRNLPVHTIFQMAYSSTLGPTGTGNPNTFIDCMLQLLDHLPLKKVGAGLESLPCKSVRGTDGSDCIAGAAIDFCLARKISQLSVWPGGGFSNLSTSSPDMQPAGSTWFQLLAKFQQGTTI